MTRCVSLLGATALVAAVALTAACEQGGADVVRNVGSIVASTSPPSNHDLQTSTSSIEVVFNAELEPSRVGNYTLTVNDLRAKTSVDGKVTYDSVTRSSQFTPNVPWSPDGRYLAVVSNGEAAKTGMKFEVGAYRWLFFGPGGQGSAISVSQNEINVEVSQLAARKSAAHLTNVSGEVSAEAVKGSDIYLLGSTSRGDGTGQSMEPVFNSLSKYDKKGVELWTLPLSDARSQVAKHFLVDKEGSSFVAATASVNDTALGDASVDGHLYKVSTTGQLLRTARLDIASDSNIMIDALSGDGADGLLVSGIFIGAFFGDKSLNNADSFLARYDSNLTRTWLEVH